MERDIRDCVVVITGASSGIGRAAAREFARRGASLILAARSESSLEEVVEECMAAGGYEPLIWLTDVTSHEQVQALARRALDRFGRVDVWINNAAVTLVAKFEDAPLEAYERVIRTNLFGYIYGARAVLPIFRAQANGGLLINNVSVAGVVGQPYASAYVASQFAIRGLSESLRQETRDSCIDVCTVLPASIDTPLLRHAAVFSGRAPKAALPVYDARQVVAAFLGLFEKPEAEVFVGASARQLSWLARALPRWTSRVTGRKFERKQLYGPGSVLDRPGNLFDPQPDQNAVSGGWLSPARRAVRYAARGLAAAPLIAGAVYWSRRRRRRALSRD